MVLVLEGEKNCIRVDEDLTNAKLTLVIFKGKFQDPGARMIGEVELTDYGLDSLFNKLERMRRERGKS
jgi:hypothetical protein